MWLFPGQHWKIIFQRPCILSSSPHFSRPNTESTFGLAHGLNYFTLEKEKLSNLGRTPYSSFKKKNLSSSWKLVRASSRKEGLGTAVPEWAGRMLITVPSPSLGEQRTSQTSAKGSCTHLTFGTAVAYKPDPKHTPAQTQTPRHQEPRAGEMGWLDIWESHFVLTKAPQEKSNLTKQSKMKFPYTQASVPLAKHSLWQSIRCRAERKWNTMISEFCPVRRARYGETDNL